jgi:hypothetical protein
MGFLSFFMLNTAASAFIQELFKFLFYCYSIDDELLTAYSSPPLISSCEMLVDILIY